MATMHRFFVATPLAAGDVDLPSQIGHQVGSVLRLRPGDPIVLFDGSGGEWTAELIAVGRRGVRARLVDQAYPRREPALRVTLCQALLKADRFEWVLQKGTELGVSAFQPLLTRRTVAGGGSSDGPGGARSARWQRIVTEAAEQSGRCFVPTVAAPVAFAAALDDGPATVLCWEAERRHGFAAALAHAAGAGRGSVRLMIGPEGGFEPAEAEAALAAGAHPASLGRRILRSETAALAAVSLTCLEDGSGRRGVDLRP